MANISQCPNGSAQYILSFEPELAWGIQPPIIDSVIVTLCQQLNLAVWLLVHLQYSMNDWNIPVFDFEHDDISHVHLLDGIVQEENITSLKGWFHRPRKHDDDRRFALIQNGKIHQGFKVHRGSAPPRVH